MTAVIIPLAGAPSASLTWPTIDWETVITEVRRLQMRIAKAFREGRRGKAKALQWLLTHSFYAKLLAVKRVVSNQGAKTPGIDEIVWKSSADKMEAVNSLKRRGYKTLPLKRIYIPKKQKGKFRPLSIPPMICRAQQALHLLSLEPVSEMLADKHTYGFRPLKSTADAIEQCFTVLARKTSAQWILEGDIKACFDSISKSWLCENTPMDKIMLRKWLDAGYIDKGEFYPTEQGVAQGGPISPALLLVTLSGMESTIKRSVNSKDKVNVVVYADDFIVTGATKEVLENKVKPAIEGFLRERGLTLSQEKTKLTHINEGFDFLGVNIRKYKSKLIMKPAKSNVKRFLVTMRETIKQMAAVKTEILIQRLNSKIRGWANYYRHVCSSQTFSYVDYQIFQALWRWATKRHSNKGKRWIHKNYFRSKAQRNWVFYAKVKAKEKGAPSTYLDLIKASDTPIKRHIKMKAEATPYKSEYHEYLTERLAKRRGNNKPKRAIWWLSWWNLLKPRKERPKVTGSLEGVAL